MFFVLLYLVGVTATLSLFPHWSTAAALLVPLVVVGLLRLAATLYPRRTKAPPVQHRGH